MFGFPVSHLDVYEVDQGRVSYTVGRSIFMVVVSSLELKPPLVANGGCITVHAIGFAQASSRRKVQGF